MRKNTIIRLFPLLLAAVAGLSVEAQNTVVTGSNLNIGSGNTLLLNNQQNTYFGNAVGQGNIVLSAGSIALGTNDTIDELSTCSVAIGSSNRVSDVGSMAFGGAVKVSSLVGVGIGRFLKATGNTGCMVIGTGITGVGQNAPQYLLNSHPYSLAVGFNSTVPTLFVGTSPNGNGLQTTDRTGRVAIGNVTPQAKLHIRSDDGEDAELILEPYDSKDNHTRILLHDGNHELSVMPDGTMRMQSEGLLNMQASNVHLQDTRMDLGHNGERKLTLSMADTPAFLCNAYRSNGIYWRQTPGSSYALEFGDDTLKIRSAVNQDPRGVEITNWNDPLQVTATGDVIVNGNTLLGGSTTMNGATTLFGKVGVNIANTTQNYALAVDGGVITTKVHIQTVGDWSDNVFNDGYRLASLEELRGYIAENRHLPGIPSEAEVTENGIDLGTMQAALLQKIEELTLYILGQQREIDTLRKELDGLRGRASFAYDACGNRISRTLELKREDEGGNEGASPVAKAGIPVTESDGSGLPACDRVGDLAYSIFPNPTEGRLTLMTEGETAPGRATATLLTLTGAVLEQRAVRGSAEEFDLGTMPPGVYLLRLASGGETHTWRVVKGN